MAEHSALDYFSNFQPGCAGAWRASCHARRDPAADRFHEPADIHAIAPDNLGIPDVHSGWKLAERVRSLGSPTLDTCGRGRYRTVVSTMMRTPLLYSRQQSLGNRLACKTAMRKWPTCPHAASECELDHSCCTTSLADGDAECSAIRESGGKGVEAAALDAERRRTPQGRTECRMLTSHDGGRRTMVCHSGDRWVRTRRIAAYIRWSSTWAIGAMYLSRRPTRFAA